MKIDQKTDLKRLYSPPTHPVIVEVPELSYLMIDGVIGEAGVAPGVDPGFRAAIGALYGTTYTIKFASKAAGRDFVVMPLEGLFWADGTSEAPPSSTHPMRWTLMILQPPWITQGDVGDAQRALGAKGKPSGVPSLRLDTLTEGPAAQVLHVGPYDEERPTIEKLHAFIAEQHLEPRMKHHEIYLGDPNRTAPQRLRTVIRQPVGAPGR